MSILNTILTTYATSYVTDWAWSYAYKLIAPRVFKAIRPVVPACLAHLVTPAEVHVCPPLANLIDSTIGIHLRGKWFLDAKFRDLRMYDCLDDTIWTARERLICTRGQKLLSLKLDHEKVEALTTLGIQARTMREVIGRREAQIIAAGGDRNIR